MYPNPGFSLKTFIKGLNIPGILDGTSKTLGVINQAIPIIYQVKPLIGNINSIFKIGNIMNSDDSSESTRSDDTNKVNETDKNISSVFFI